MLNYMTIIKIFLKSITRDHREKQNADEEQHQAIQEH
jgi:hypothetical protein